MIKSQQPADFLQQKKEQSSSANGNSEWGRAPKSEDFAHLNAIIEKLHKHGFSDAKKITNFKATEDLLITTHKSYIAAWVVDQVRKEIPDWDSRNPQQRKDAAAQILCARGTTWTEKNIIVMRCSQPSGIQQPSN